MLERMPNTFCKARERLGKKMKANQGGKGRKRQKSNKSNKQMLNKP